MLFIESAPSIKTKRVKGNDGTLGFFADKSSKGIKIQKIPVLIPGLENIVDVVNGLNHVLALDTNGAVWSWGCGSQAQLGTHAHYSRRHKTGSKYVDLIPKQVFFWKKRKNIKIAKIGAGHYCSFAVDVDGQVWGWGLNNYGQVGLGRADGMIYTPTVLKLLSLHEILSIKGGEHHTLAIAKNGMLLSWGRCDDHQIGKPLSDIPENHILLNEQKKPAIVTEPTVVPSEFS
jgi:regulator of chromosome condensation